LVWSWPAASRHHERKTLSAATAGEALAILTGSEAVDALFVDIILNGDMQAGIELAKRAVEMKPRLKVVYSTGPSVTDGLNGHEFTARFHARQKSRNRVGDNSV
jgi:DNA-binding LytR/AlgR family response regulator